MTSIKDRLIREARRVEEDSLYSAKGHFSVALRWGRVRLWLGVPTSILAAIAGVSALAQFDNHNIVAGLLAILVAALTAVSTFLNPNEKANSHHNAGTKYNSLRNRIRIFYNIDCAGEDSEQKLTTQLKDLAKERDELNLSNPQIPRWAYREARKTIEEGEADYKVDEENKT